ncbi:hypothetical protein Tco_0291795 [Tanacetum coccineum]
MNEDYYHEQNSCYDYNSFGFDQFLPQPLPVIDPTPLEKGMEELRIAFQAWSDNIRQKKKEEEKRIAEEQAAKDRYWKIPICYDDEEDYTIAFTPVSSTKEPVNSLSIGDEHLDTIPATESDEVIKSSVKDLVPIPSESRSVEIVIPEFEGFDEDIVLTIKTHILREKLLNINLLIANIKALKDNPAPFSDVMTKSSSS